MNLERLELLLRDTAAEIDYPPTPPLDVAVIVRLTRDPVAPERRRRSWVRPALVTAAIVVLIGLFGMVFSPTVRRAAADLLGLVGIHIVVGSEGDGLTPAPVQSGLGLGERVPYTGISERVGFPVKAPVARSVAGLGPAVFLDRSIGDTGMVSLVYPHDARAHPDVELLITQFEAAVDEAYFKKVAVTEGDVRYVNVSGSTGYWITGEPHLFYYVDSDGAIREETVRLAGNVLLWEEDGITYRVEGAEALSEAQAIAESLR